MFTGAPVMPVQTEENDPVTPSPGSRWRKSAVALVSAAILVAGALFVAAPAQSSVALSVREGGLTGRTSVVYGKVVDRRGNAAAHVRVRMVRWVNGERHVVRAKRTDRDGLFRFKFRHPKRVGYNVRVVARRNGHTYVGWHGIKMRPGRAFEVSSRLTRKNRFFFLPVSTY